VPSFLQWLRGRECFISLQDKSHECSGKVRACHFDPWGDKGMATKVSDQASMPMCDGAHAEQTDILGWPKFQRKYAFDGRDVVTAYWLEMGGQAWLRAPLSALSENRSASLPSARSTPPLMATS
jgi:hypothetical protein